MAFGETLWEGLAQCPVHEKGLMVLLLFPIGCPRKPMGPRQTGTAGHPENSVVIPLPSWQVGDVLCCIPFCVFSFPPARKIRFWVISPVGEWVESGGQSTFWRALGWKGLGCDIIYLPWEGRQKKPSGYWTQNYLASDGHEISDSKTGIGGLLVVGSALSFGQTSVAPNFIKKDRF